jgi:hypothetical protein
MNSMNLLLFGIGMILIGFILRDELKKLWYKDKKWILLYPLLLLLPLIIPYLFSFLFPLEWKVFWEMVVDIILKGDR